MNAAMIITLSSITLGSLSCSNALMEDKKQCRPIYYDSSSDDATCFQLQSDLAVQSRDGSLAGVKEAVKKGANVNGGAEPYLRPLILAATGGHDEIVEFLLSQGAEINATSSGIGDTPLTAAITQGHSTTVKLLVSHGADVCLKTEGMTPMMITRGDESDEIVQMLIEAGADKCPSTLPGSSTPGNS